MTKATSLPATSRDRDDYREATKAARATRARTGAELAAAVAVQVQELLVAGDVMGGDGMLVLRIQKVAEAKRRGDPLALRGAYMDLAVAAGACVAALDHRPPSHIAA